MATLPTPGSVPKSSCTPGRTRTLRHLSSCTQATVRGALCINGGGGHRRVEAHGKPLQLDVSAVNPRTVVSGTGALRSSRNSGYERITSASRAPGASRSATARRCGCCARPCSPSASAVCRARSRRCVVPQGVHRRPARAGGTPVRPSRRSRCPDGGPERLEVSSAGIACTTVDRDVERANRLQARAMAWARRVRVWRARVRARRRTSRPDTSPIRIRS